MMSDDPIVTELCRNDRELAHAVTEHRRLDARIERMGRCRSLSPEEVVELRRLKKIKLLQREAIARKLDQLQTDDHARNA